MRERSMCEPVSITMAVTAAVSAASSFYIQSENVGAQNKQREQETLNALGSYENQIKQAAVQQDQSDSATALRLEDAKRKGAQARSKVLVRAGEAGIDGNSVGLLIDDLNAQEARYESSVMQQADFDSINRQFQLEGMQKAAEGRVQNAAQLAGPSAGLALLDLSTQLAGIYASSGRQTVVGGES